MWTQDYKKKTHIETRTLFQMWLLPKHSLTGHIWGEPEQ